MGRFNYEQALADVEALAEIALAIEQGRKGVEMDPNFPLSHRGLARAYSAKSMYREAASEWQKYQDLSPGSDALANLIYCYGRAGERNQALHALEMLQERSRKGFVPAYSFALAYTGLDEKDPAFARELNTPSTPRGL